ncbi:hypothetical protein ASD31_13740 [Rhizobium sp. Root482]|jgi:hypothetical protein|nr:hypothetical protein ASD31_13740 [Rhizobium sp. Root482]
MSAGRRQRTRGGPCYRAGLGRENETVQAGQAFGFMPAGLYGTGQREEDEDSSWGSASVWMGGMPFKEGPQVQT